METPARLSAIAKESSTLPPLEYMTRSFRFRTDEHDLGKRLDQVIPRHVESLSRTKTRNVLAWGGVFVDGQRTKIASRLMRADQELVVHVSAALEQTEQREQEEEELLQITPLFEDAHLLIVDKPSGVFSAPTPESDRNNLWAVLERARGRKIHLVHRLDRPTSGLMVFAKDARAAAALSELFQEHRITRSYFAVLTGPLEESVLDVETPLEGRAAHTRFTLLERKPTASLVRAELFTGRTHQVRLHAESLGHPIAGDSKYGRRQQRLLPLRPTRLALHAEHLGFLHPEGHPVSWSSPLPGELADYWTKLPS